VSFLSLAIKHSVTSLFLVYRDLPPTTLDRSGSRTSLQITLGGGNPSGRDVSNTSSRDPLKELRRLDKSSPRFRDQISDILHAEEYKQCVSDLQGDDLAWLVDYLDQVRLPVSLVRFLLKPP